MVCPPYHRHHSVYPFIRPPLWTFPKWFLGWSTYLYIYFLFVLARHLAHRIMSDFTTRLLTIIDYSLASSILRLYNLIISFSMALRPNAGHGHLILEVLDHTQRRTAFGMTPLDEWSARHRDLYLTAHNIHNRQTSMPPVGFEPTIPADERPQTYALTRYTI